MKEPGGAPLVAVLAAAVVVSLTTGTAAAVRRSAAPAATLTAGQADRAHDTSSVTPAVAATAATGPDVAYDVVPAPGTQAGTIVLAGGAARPAADLVVSLQLRQQTVAVGDVVEADLGVDDSDGVPAEYVLDWGDARARPNEPAARCGAVTTVASYQPRPTHWTNRVEYSYRKPGRYTVVYRMRTHGGCGTTAAAEEQTARAVITVVKGPLPTNGGRRPQAFLSLSSQGKSGDVVVDVQGQDLDGWVTQMIVDFGDGTPARMVENPSRCVAGKDEWPSTPYFSHRYDAPYQVVGSYTATLTVFTAGCDGTSVQQTTVRQQVVVPKPVA